MRAAVSAISAPPTRARNPRRELFRASESIARSRGSGTDRQSPQALLRRTLARAEPVRSPAFGGGQNALELGEVVERPLREHHAVGSHGQRERATRDLQASPELGVRDLIEGGDGDLGSFATFSMAGAMSRQMWQPSDVNTASPRRSAAAGSRSSREVRPSARDPISGPPPRSRARPASGAEAGASRPPGRGREPRSPAPRIRPAQPRSRSRAIPVWRSRSRRATGRPRRRRPGRRSARRRARRPWSAARSSAGGARASPQQGGDGECREQGDQRRRGVGAGVRAERDRHAEHELGGDQARPGDRAEVTFREAVAGQRGDAQARRGELRERGAREHHAKHDPQNDLDIPPAAT